MESKSTESQLVLLFIICIMLDTTHSGMINCQGRIYSVEDTAIEFSMCCGKMLFDARTSRCRRPHSSSQSHKHFHDFDEMALIVFDDSLKESSTTTSTPSTRLPSIRRRRVGSAKRPYCVEGDRLMWTHVERGDKTNEPLSYFPIGSIGCCGRRLYRKLANFCCGSVLYRKSNSGQLCCGGIYYPMANSPQYLTCCNDTLVDVRARPQCLSAENINS